MEIFNPNANIPFMSWRKMSMAVSVFLMIASVALLATRGLNLALDFTGGTLIEATSVEALDSEKVRGTLAAGGFDGFTVQSIGGSREIAIRVPPLAGENANNAKAQAQVVDRVKSTLAQAGINVDIKRSEFVGPQVGDELKEDGVIAVVFVLLTIMLYVAMRFEWRFGFSAMAGQIHDVIITLGFISLLQLSFDLTVLAAVLTVAGYSINDKVVVFDRVREIFRSARKMGPVESINKAINNTLSRTLITGITVFMALFSLFFLGGPVVENFALTSIVGIAIGTLSSIFFCNPILLWMGVSKADLKQIRPEDPALAARP